MEGLTTEQLATEVAKIGMKDKLNDDDRTLLSMASGALVVLSNKVLLLNSDIHT